MVSAIPSSASNNYMSGLTKQLRDDLDRASIESVTGLSQDVVGDTNGKTAELHRAENQLAQTQADQARLSVVEGRHNTAGVAYETVRESTDGFGMSTLTAATTQDAAGINAAATEAEALLDQTFAALNTSYDGRYLFAGDDATSAPMGDVDQMLEEIAVLTDAAATTADKMAAIDSYFAPGGGFDTNIYQGGTGDASSANLPDGTSVDPIPSADSDGFRDLIKGLVYAVELPKIDSADQADWAGEGNIYIIQGQDQIRIDEAANGSTQNQIDRAQDAVLDQELEAKRTIDNMIGVDEEAAAVEVQDLEVRLEAAYTLISRLNSLSFVNFIR